MNHQGSCHCGNVKFEVQINDLNGLTCDCSICHRKGSVLNFVSKNDFKALSGLSNLTDYQFGKKSIHHTFCKTCGVTAFATGQLPDGTEMMAINLRCVDGIDIGQIKINHYNGKAL